MHLHVIQTVPAPAALKPCCARPEVGDFGWTCPMHPQVVKPSPGTCDICGMPLEPIGADSARAPARQHDSLRLVISTILGGILVVVAMVPMLEHVLPEWLGGHAVAGVFAGFWLTGQAGLWVQCALATPIVFWGGWPILSAGISGYFAGRPGMFSLITLGVLAAWLSSAIATLAPSLIPDAFREADGTVPAFYESAGMIVVLVLLGQWLETRARRGTTAAIRSLMDLAPPTAERVGDANHAAFESPQTIPVAAVVVGDLLRVKPGGRVPVDGVVREGSTSCDEALLTGEPLTVAKHLGDRVLGGSINGNGAVVIEATAASGDSLVARITRLVRESHAKRAPIESLADGVSGWFVPAVLVAAFATFVGWALFGPQPRMALGLMSAISVLVIACPCALGLATPLAMTVAIGRGAREGVLIRSAEAVERLASVATVVFDKTGTLTRGQPRIVAAGISESLGAPVDAAITGEPFVNFKTGSYRELLALATAVEVGSEHGLARAFTDAATTAGLHVPLATDVSAVVGRGVRGVVGNRTVLVGSERFLRDEGIDIRGVDIPGTTVVQVAEGERVVGWFAIADEPRPEARDVVSDLSGRGLAIEILSGDAPAVVARVASAIGITASTGGLSPVEKAMLVESLVGTAKGTEPRGGSIVFVGDGINDAPALAAADVGIAMGAGADVALETADVTLLSGGLTALPRAFDLADDTMRIVRQNLALAFLYNLIAIPAAAGVLYPLVGHVTSPMLAAAAMTLSSLSVIANSLRLRGG